MIITKKHGLPENFLWGASTSAYQVEGANLSHGKGPSVQDIKTVPAGTSELDVCADFYHRYAEDINTHNIIFHVLSFSAFYSLFVPLYRLKQVFPASDHPSVPDSPLLVTGQESCPY